MSLLDFVRLLMQYKKWLLLFPVAIAILVYSLTVHQPRVYRSQMLLYTGIVPSADGNPNNTVRVDVFAVNNAFDNLQTIITSRQVLEETGLRLLAFHLEKRNNKRDSLEATIHKILAEHAEFYSQAVSKAHGADTYGSLQKMAQNGQLQWFLEEDASPYSYNTLKGNLKIRRTGSSDLLELSFEASEASVARQTLILLSDAFARRYKEMRKTEAGSMVAFFEKEVAKAAQNLSVRGEEMTQFQKQNRIINYYEQTHLTAIETEHLNGEFYNEVMKLAASEEALKELQSKLGNTLEMALSSNEILESQKTLASLRTKKLLSTDVATDSIVSIQIDKEESMLKNSIGDLYVEGRTPEGVSKKEILKQWLDQFIAVSEGRARVEIMKQRKAEQEKVYDFFAPLGSRLHNYERQMDVAEREYLDLLHSLNQARLRQQNLETTNNLTTVDEPNFPSKAEPSKQKVLVAAAWLGSLVLMITIILGVEYLESSLQSPERSEIKTGLEVAGALPDSIESPVGQLAWSNFMSQVASRIELGKPSKKQRLLLVSRTPMEASHEIGSKLLGGIQSTGIECKLNETLETGITPSQIDINLVTSLTDISKNWGLMRWPDVVMYIMDANKPWSVADKKAIQLLEQATQKKPLLVLTHVQTDRLENWLGELPKKRSRLRVNIKRLLQFQFH